MSNTLLNTQQVSFESLDVLDNVLVLGNLANRDYNDKFAVEGAKIGDSFSQRKPQRYVVQSGEAIGDIADLSDDTVTVRIEHQDHIAISYGQAERRLSIDDYRRRYINPQMVSLANKVDKRGYALYTGIWNNSGTPASPPTTSEAYLDAGVRLANNAAPMDDEMAMIITPRMMQKIVQGEQTLFHASEELRKMYLRGEMGTAHGFTWYRSQNPVTHRVGAWVGAGAVSGADQTGSSLTTNGWTGTVSKLLRKGDTFTIAGVNQVNPQTYEDTGELQQFVVNADVDSNAGDATITFSPPIITSGALQTVTAAPANGALITVSGAAGAVSPQGLGLHRDAMSLTVVDLPEPSGGADYKRVMSKKLRLAFSMVSQFDVKTYKNICRLDILYGWTLVRPELAVRVHG